MLFFSCGAGAAATAVHQTNQTNVYWPNRNSNGSSPGRRMQFHMMRNTYVRRNDYTSAVPMRICALLPMTSWKKTSDAFSSRHLSVKKKSVGRFLLRRPSSSLWLLLHYYHMITSGTCSNHCMYAMSNEIYFQAHREADLLGFFSSLLFFWLFV